VNKHRILLAIGILAWAAAGCGKPHPAPEARRDVVVLDRNRFADLFIELRRAAIDADSAPDFAERKRAILERYGVTDQDLLDYVERNSGDLGELVATWDSIYRRLSRTDSAVDSTDQ